MYQRRSFEESPNRLIGNVDASKALVCHSAEEAPQTLESEMKAEGGQLQLRQPGKGVRVVMKAAVMVGQHWMIKIRFACLLTLLLD